MYLNNRKVERFVHDMELCIIGIEDTSMRAGAWGVLNDFKDMLKTARATGWTDINAEEPPEDALLMVKYTAPSMDSDEYEETIGTYSRESGGWYLPTVMEEYRVLAWHIYS